MSGANILMLASAGKPCGAVTSGRAGNMPWLAATPWPSRDRMKSMNARAAGTFLAVDTIATGSVTGNASDCVNYIGGIIKRCSDVKQFNAALALYDARVQTKDGQPISVWGTPRPGSL